MMVEALQMDSDDASDLVIEIERSFGVNLGKNLTHIVTVGDLHDAIVGQLGDPSGGPCPTSRTFYRLRRLIDASLARPETPLASLWAGSPRALNTHLRNATGWSMPGLFIGWIGGISLIVGVIAALILGWLVSGWLILPALALGMIGLRLDGGIWAGNWTTVGSLTRSVAALNFASLCDDGARRSPITAWHALTALIAGYGIKPDTITRESLLCG